MSDNPAAEIQLLRSQKAKLIQILSGDANFVLQHADSRGLLSPSVYQQVKACGVPSEKVTELLDHVIERGPEAVRGLLELLNEQALQESFPMLSFIKDLHVDMSTSGTRETSRKRKPDSDLEDTVPSKQINNNSVIFFSHGTGPSLVNEKQLTIVARTIGKSWRSIGREALDIPSTKLEQIEEDHSLHVERVFAMLRHWKNKERDKATASHLHFLLSQGDFDLPSENIGFLLKTD